MDPDSLESTNQRLHDLERKLSLVSTSSSAYTAQSHGSVVQDPTHSGLARQNIQSSVLQYIKGHTSEFDADRVFSDRQQRFATTFGREYSPSQSHTTLEEMKNKKSGDPQTTSSFPASDHENDTETTFHVKQSVHKQDQDEELSSDYGSDNYADYFDDDGFDSADEIHPQELDAAGNFNDEYDDEYDDDDDDDNNDVLLPPSPPRSPPREMDPSKLYGLFDFSGPDPSHCTLHRDEPVYLLNDSDNYWWLIRKLNKAERQILWHERGSHEDIASDNEDGKIGFVPAECLETYGERLARLNCFKNEELERFSRETLPPSDSHSELSVAGVTDVYESKTSSATLGRSNSILKKTGSFGPSNKSVTFENLGEFHVEEDDDTNNTSNDSYSDDAIGFTDSYYSIGRDDVPKNAYQDAETHSEVLSDIYPAEAPLQIRKPRGGNLQENPEFRDFTRPKMLFTGDDASIGSFSPDTPPTKKYSASAASDEEEEGQGKLRRSLILDRLNIVTSGINAQADEIVQDAVDEPTFGGSLHSYVPSGEESDGGIYDRFYSDGSKVHSPVKGIPEGQYQENEGSDDQDSRKSLSAEDVSTPLTSVNSLNCISSPKAPVSMIEKKRKRPVHDMFMPILGQLDELTEKLAELEHIL